ncbi:YueI family protein [Loigolactobacillus coryniformis]|jgi:uncharacterized protein YueI|uniref:DUF1694 domain-containing protein n=3 Tax=Loigolactobacillus coryniformis TaxID=1610 RepID=J2Z864_9LACO|nr:DUF1694 domain-containing protein [Loigolactobacillus coryniformis]MDT3392398.1 YueI family protein [Bacillota bacterium]RRG04162.1 MAG: DUF1694 domain-containing protein [Lactobacillus sp.]ATO42672.1 hypothetical protein LC20004_01485 [Loigolactobacillus coryniformis subsp. torquens DSM 20004 = KCTC 3535]EJN56778.1 Hypothetical protein A11Y_8921 [Loigolactobacillus coryniformis subsp. coryniformis CECT 5711]KRK85579.1 hypothetical protein FC16_GL000991 [Loigolactobacillus coryniformis subs
MADDIQDYLKSHVFGQPQLKPDEKRSFLGNFRERVALALTIQQLRTVKAESLVRNVLTRYPGLRIYINGRMGKTLINRYLKVAVELDYPFTILAQNGMRVSQPLTEQDFGLVIAGTQKITRPIVL